MDGWRTGQRYYYFTSVQERSDYLSCSSSLAAQTGTLPSHGDRMLNKLDIHTPTAVDRV